MRSFVSHLEWNTVTNVSVYDSVVPVVKMGVSHLSGNGSLQFIYIFYILLVRLPLYNFQLPFYFRVYPVDF